MVIMMHIIIGETSVLELRVCMFVCLCLFIGLDDVHCRSSIKVVSQACQLLTKLRGLMPLHGHLIGEMSVLYFGVECLFVCLSAGLDRNI